MDEEEIREIKQLLSRRLLAIANDIENQRLMNIEENWEQTVSMLQQLQEHTNITDVLEQVKQALSEYLTLPLMCNASCSYTSENVDEQGRKGRPEILVPEEMLQYYVGEGFTSSAMANFMGVSERTIKRRLGAYGIKIRATYCELSDLELNDKVSNIIEQFPNIGQKSISGHLLSEGYRIQQWTVKVLVFHIFWVYFARIIF